MQWLHHKENTNFENIFSSFRWMHSFRSWHIDNQEATFPSVCTKMNIIAELSWHVQNCELIALSSLLQ